MVRTKGLLIASAAVWLSACTDTTGPPTPQPPAARLLHQLKWEPMPTPRQFAVVGSVGEPKLAGIAGAAGAAGITVLDRYQASFWARADQDRAVQISYRAAEGAWQPYLGLTVPAAALLQRPNGTSFSASDSVLITVTIDTTALVVEFEPTGLVFSDATPAQLSIWYTGASGDYDQNGQIDGTDANIEQRLLGLWVQERITDPWASLTATHTVADKRFVADVRHFSGYSLSW